MSKTANETILKVGERYYKIVENTDIKGVKIFSVDGLALTSSTKVFWWDKEGLINLIENSMDVIEKRLKNA